jgi:hypothetical protein
MVRGGQVEEFYLAVDSCITKPCGGDAAGRSALDLELADAFGDQASSCRHV